MNHPAQAPQPPRWKEDFPINWEDDAYITRKEFIKFLGLTSIVFLFGTCLTAGRRWLRESFQRRSPPMSIGHVDEIPVGGYKLFRYPGPDDPCILLRPGPEQFVAFSQLCTHLACPVHYQAETGQLVCPCHEAFFKAEDGTVLAGPPRRPLTRFAVVVRDKQLWIQPVSKVDG